ncbi:unnamed protein product [Protopolystoma xenopodis]|uniref:Serine/threonine-protein phosphatase 2A 55 kDa regulatory subunit B n=1 Tax=Protopolystoma xenopodis TaxID=117903 RepID=A0A3S5AWW9_9PLAT|nr:unnamed protein product [Protopolystoma xenopodis]
MNQPIILVKFLISRLIRPFSLTERTIKLWRLSEVPVQEVSNMNFPTQSGCRKKVVIRSSSDIRVPAYSNEAQATIVRMSNKHTYTRGHGFSITDIAPCADMEYFLSADPLRINLWNLHVHDESFNVVDLMPPRMEDISHLITGLVCANRSPSLFAYSTNRGSIRLCDTRSSALCDRPILTFDSLAADEPSLLTLLINSISSISFGNTSDRFVFARDYLNVKVWDIQMPSCPMEVYPIQAHLRSHLSVIYDAELIFDDFKLAISPDDR